MTKLAQGYGKPVLASHSDWPGSIDLSSSSTHGLIDLSEVQCMPTSSDTRMTLTSGIIPCKSRRPTTASLFSDSLAQQGYLASEVKAPYATAVAHRNQTLLPRHIWLSLSLSTNDSKQ